MSAKRDGINTQLKSQLLQPQPEAFSTSTRSKRRLPFHPAVMRLFLPLILTASVADAWRLAFYLGSDCMGEELSTVSYPYGSACNQLSSSTTNVQSVLSTKDSPDDDDYEVALYDSDDCTGETLGVISDEAVCYPDRRGTPRAYRVQAINQKRGLKRSCSPFEVSRDVDAWLERRATGPVIRDTDLDLAPAKSHPNITAISIASVNVDNFDTYLSAGIAVVTGAPSFTSLVSGCIGVADASPISSLSCATSLAGTVISFLVASYHAYQGLKGFRATLRNNNVELGIRRPRNRRSIGDTMTIVGYGSRGQTGKRQKVVVLRELQRAIIYTTR